MKRRLLVAPAWTLRDVASNDQLADRGYFRSLERPDGAGAARQLGAFVRATGAPLPAPARPAPRLGAHTSEVLGEWGEAATAEPAPAAPPPAGAPLPLEGVKILDFMWALAGPGCTLVRIDQAAFDDLVRRVPGLALEVMRVMARRLRKANPT